MAAQTNLAIVVACKPLAGLVRPLGNRDENPAKSKWMSATSCSVPESEHCRSQEQRIGGRRQGLCWRCCHCKHVRVALETGSHPMLTSSNMDYGSRGQTASGLCRRFRQHAYVFVAAAEVGRELLVGVGHQVFVKHPQDLRVVIRCELLRVVQVEDTEAMLRNTLDLALGRPSPIFCSRWSTTHR